MGSGKLSKGLTKGTTETRRKTPREFGLPDNLAHLGYNSESFQCGFSMEPITDTERPKLPFFHFLGREHTLSFEEAKQNKTKQTTTTKNSRIDSLKPFH